MTISEKKKLFTRTLFAWHKKNYREMDWRNTRDPYRILVSEVMLQQTQVERVKTKYREFLKKFPTIQVLASASLGDVLRVWSGLGYNRRARYLHECAKEVVSQNGGKFPNELHELMKLSGIGLSTAGALLAFSFDEDVPMIDTNIRRILSRVFFSTPRPDLKNSKGRALVLPDKKLYEFAQSLIPKGKGRMWNYAMLDLGATLCTARNHSQNCPLAKLHGSVGDFQHKKPQKKFTGSPRYFRGRAIALLARGNGGVSELVLQKRLVLLGATGALATQAMAGLKKDRMIVVRKGKIFFP